MQRFHVLPLLTCLGLVTLSGCSLSRSEPPPAAEQATGSGAPAPAASAAPADASPNAPLATSRKVIRAAELGIEVASPSATESSVSSLVERLGGYVASSERQVVTEAGARADARVKLSLRVPSARLDEALREIKRLGRGDETEKLSSSDVTDEYIDLAARIDNERQLERQLAGLLTQTANVESALKVHQELANVRTEIDRLEGHKRFLETETAFSKIELTLSALRPLVAATPTGFGVELRRAAADGIDVASGIVTLAIRALGVLLPIAVMLGLPTTTLALWLARRRRRRLSTAAA